LFNQSHGIGKQRFIPLKARTFTLQAFIELAQKGGLFNTGKELKKAFSPGYSG